MSAKVQSVRDLAVKVANDPKLEEEIKENPAGALSRIAAEPLLKDVWIYRIVVGVLGLAILLSLSGAIVLYKTDKTTPEILVAIGSAAVGALAGLLAPSPAS